MGPSTASQTGAGGVQKEVPLPHGAMTYVLTPNSSSFPMCLCHRSRVRRVVSLPRNKEGGNRGEKLGSPKMKTPGGEGGTFSWLRCREEKSILVAEGWSAPRVELHELIAAPLKTVFILPIMC